ncbi:hypothetical protein EV673_0185 [Limnobacter thiooxidans]|uniref:Uncharacterized protein n=1 Tax=Limnobacter thiooxidans TaxID=131080 RepID=A0AA86ME71_9BURK|nr:hypothetical protein EV673_0185 [Limnobacter thiooxidans]BET26696.1 hypothetical protein RGQ30_21970 [Limnobacter thiooxidans]
MPQIKWNSFIPANAAATFFTAAVSATLPGGPHFDKMKKKLPTPYGLFQEWANNNLQGDWASTKMKGYFAIGVADATDVALLVNQFGVVGTTKLNFGNSMARQLNYTDSGFGNLASQLGYTVK